MATLTFTFDTGSVPLADIVDAICYLYSYPPLVDGEPNPQTKADFARQQVKTFIVSAIKAKRAADIAAGVADPVLT